jgi:two-component system response regulator DevR
VSGEDVIRVFLLDDHEVVRRGVRQLLDAERDIEVVGEADSAELALARLPAVRPDVALLDVRLPDGDGVTVCREIRSKFDDVACLIFTSFSDEEALVQAILAGASGFLLKRVRANDIVDAVRKVAAGGTLLDPNAVDRAAERLRHPPTEDLRLASLTDREREILALIAEGLSNRQIGDELELAEKTIKNYVSNLLAKLGMERRTQAGVFAARLNRDDATLRTSDA